MRSQRKNLPGAARIKRRKRISLYLITVRHKALERFGFFVSCGKLSFIGNDFKQGQLRLV